MSTAHPLTAEMIVDGRVPSDPQLSPDGRFVAFVVTTVGRRGQFPQSELWVARTDGTAPPRQMTAGVVSNTQPRWSGDGAWLYFVSDRAVRGTGQLQRLAMAGGEAEALTDWKSGVGDYAPLPDCQTVAFLATDPPTDDDARRERERDDADVYGERWQRKRLRLLDLASREVRTIDALGERHVSGMAVSPDGRQIAVISWPTPDIDNAAHPAPLHLVDLVAGTARELCVLPMSGSSLTWTSDGATLAYIAHAVQSGASGNGLFTVRVAEPTPRWVTGDLAACPTQVTSRGTSELLVTLATGLDTMIACYDPATNELSQRVQMPGDLGSLTICADGQTLAALHSTASEGFNVWAGPLTGPLARRTDLRPELRDIPWGAQERLEWEASDGLAIDGLLILPPGKSRDDGPFPLVTIVHGGPYGRFADGLQLNYAPSGQWIATAGYAVLLPNPRGGLGHGHDFAYQVAGRVGLEDWGDVQAGIDHLIASGVADPTKLGIGGWSQGGFMTAWAVGQTERFRCGVMGAGVSDWGMMVAESDMMTFEAALGGSTGWEGPGPHQHDRISPISYIHRVKTPVLMLHGERDARVPVSQAQFFARGLRRYGVPNELVVYPREPHGIQERTHQLDVLRRTREWFDRWMKD